MQGSCSSNPLSSSRSLAFIRASILILLLLLPIFSLVLSWLFLHTTLPVQSTHQQICDDPCTCNCTSSSTGNAGTTQATDEMDPMLRKEMGTHVIDLLSEELILQKMVAAEGKRKAKSVLQEAERWSYQYAREALKCNLCMETCEAARERARKDLAMEEKLSEKWKQKAVALGWNDTIE